MGIYLWIIYWLVTINFKLKIQLNPLQVALQQHWHQVRDPERREHHDLQQLPAIGRWKSRTSFVLGIKRSRGTGRQDRAYSRKWRPSFKKLKQKTKITFWFKINIFKIYFLIEKGWSMIMKMILAHFHEIKLSWSH